MHQSLILILMVLTPEDVSKVRFGSLTPQAMDTLRIIRDAFGVVFRIKEDRVESDADRNRRVTKIEGDDDDEEEEEEEEDDNSEPNRNQATANHSLPPRVTYLLSCLGIGYTNVNRRVT